jgi:hypothetical protein
MIPKRVFKVVEADGHGILVSMISGDKGDGYIKIIWPIFWLI